MDLIQLGRDYVAKNAAESGADSLILDMADEIERLRAALKPFVQARGSIKSGDLSGALSVICMNDFHRAAKAFGNEQSGDGK